MVQRKPTLRRGLKHVHRKSAKGKEYFYFDTGQKKDGKPILRPLPHIRAPEFARAYQAAQQARSRRDGVKDIRTFEWLARAWENSQEWRKLSENSKRLYSRHIGYAVKRFRSAEGISWPLGIVKSDHVLELRDRFVDEPGKANAVIRSIGALYHWAGRKGRNYVTENIAHDIDALETGEHKAWPKELVELALEDPSIRLPVALLYFTGQRIGDVVRLGKGNVSQGTLSLKQQKTGTTIRMPIHKRLAEILETDAPKGAVMFLVNEHGKPLSESGVRQRIQKWAKDRGHHVVPHGLRKNAVNALLAAECSTAEVSAITGQSLQMIEHYAKERDTDLLGRSAILKFERRNKDGA